MIKLPLVLPYSPVPFALRGELNIKDDLNTKNDLNIGTGLLVVSEGCPLSLLNAIPRNPAGEKHGQLSSSWFRFIQKSKYNWALSDKLPRLDTKEPPKIYSNKGLSFVPSSQLKIVWKFYSNRDSRAKVSQYLTRRSEDLCEAIVFEKTEDFIIDLISPIILACEGYSIY